MKTYDRQKIFPKILQKIFCINAKSKTLFYIKANESSDDVLDSVKFLFKEAKVDIPESIIDRAHRIGSRYQDTSSNKLQRYNYTFYHIPPQKYVLQS